MIEYIGRSGPPEAMNCPAFICDSCRKQVLNKGKVIWAVRYVNGQRQSSPLFVSHKGPCAGRVDALVNHLYPLREGWSDLWEEASVFIGHLAHNLSRAFAEDEDGRYHDHTLVIPPIALRPRSRP